MNKKGKSAGATAISLACMFLILFAFTVTAQDKVEREIVIMFEPDVVGIPGRDRAGIDDAVMPTALRTLLKDFGADEIAKGMPEFQRADTLRVLADGRIYRVPDYTNLFVVRLPADLQREALVDSLKKLPGIVSVEKNQLAIARETIPNDAHFQTRQWNLKNTGQFGGTPGADIKATFAWDYTTGDNSVILGIIDTGVQAGHPDLLNKVSGDAGTSDFHGTHVAGIAGAWGNNSQGIAGVDWNARLNSQIIGSVTHTAQAVMDAVTAGARVLNNSWGVGSYSSVLYDAFLSAYQADVLLIVANPEEGVSGEYPNSFGSWIVNVGATTNGDNLTWYSFERDYTDVAAPGGNLDGDENHDIYSTVPTSQYGYAAGTSMAAPHVTGIAGLLLAMNPSLHNYDLEWIIKRSADDIHDPGVDDGTGYGRVNAYEAVKHVSVPYQISHGNAALTQINNDINVTFLVAPLPSLGAGMYVVDRWKLEAVVSFSPTYSETPWHG